jgi:hypothetical protein
MCLSSTLSSYLMGQPSQYGVTRPLAIDMAPSEKGPRNKIQRIFGKIFQGEGRLGAYYHQK